MDVMVSPNERQKRKFGANYNNDMCNTFISQEVFIVLATWMLAQFEQLILIFLCLHFPCLTQKY